MTADLWPKETFHDICKREVQKSDISFASSLDLPVGIR